MLHIFVVKSTRKGIAMDKPYQQHITVCPHCKTAQAIYIEHSLDVTSILPLASVMCGNEKCQRIFDLAYVGRGVGGPWLV